MTFLNPNILWAAFAILIPIIIHFFNFRRPKRVLFSNTELVKEVQKTVVKKIKLQQWLLLLTRILAILSLVFLFARPVILDSSVNAKLGGSSIAIIIDNSYSMKAGDEKGGYHLQAIKIADEIVKSFSKQDEFLIMSTDDLKLHYQFDSQDEVREEVKRNKIRQNISSYASTLEFKDAIFSKAGKPNKHLFFISDFQQSTVMTDSVSVAVADSSMEITFIPLCTRIQKNVFIERSEITSGIIQNGEPLNMKMRLVNDGGEAVKDLGIRIEVEGKVIGISNENLGVGESKEKEVTFTPNAGGWLNGKLIIDDYPIEFDNERYFSFYIPEREKALFVEDDYSPQLRIFYDSLLTQFDCQRVSIKKLSSINFNDYKFLILGGINNIPTGLQEKMELFLEQGNSILMFPGAILNISEANRFLGALNIGAFSELSTTPDGIVASKAELNHPVFEGMFKSSRGKARFEGPTVYRHYPLNINSSSLHNKIISFPNGKPFLLEALPGNGQVFIFTTFPDDSFTDIQYKAIFPSILQRLGMLMNQTRSQQQTRELGSGAFKQIKTSDKDLIKMVDKDGKDLIPEQYVKRGFVVMKFDSDEGKSGVSEGNYDLFQKEQLLEKISFNVPDSESRLACTGADDLIAKLETQNLAGINVATGSPETIVSNIKQQSEGIPLWRIFLYLVILFLLIEVGILYFKK